MTLPHIDWDQKEGMKGGGKTMPKTQERERPPSATNRVTSKSELPEASFDYPVKLIYIDQIAVDEDNPDGDSQLYLELQRYDRQWEDGNPVIDFVRERLFFDGEPARRSGRLGKLLDSFEETTGADLLSGEAEEYLNDSFMVKQEKTGRTYTDRKGNQKDEYRTVFVEHLGDEFEFQGKVRTVGGGGASASDEDSASDTPDEDEVAGQLASILDGELVADLKGGKAMQLVKESDLSGYTGTLFGKPMRGGLLKPKAVLIDELLSRGFAEETEGVFVAS